MQVEEQYKCPRDNHVLEFGTFKDVPLWRCKECQGVLIKQNLLFSLLEKLSREIMAKISIDQPINKVEDKGKGVHCPFCGKEMENYGYLESHFTMIDACHNCKVIWIDTNELGSMCIQFARTQKRYNYRQLIYENGIREPNIIDNSIIVSQAVRQVILMGFVLGSIL